LVFFFFIMLAQKLAQHAAEPHTCRLLRLAWGAPTDADLQWSLEQNHRADVEQLRKATAVAERQRAAAMGTAKLQTYYAQTSK
jgi:hypothetical protein